MRTKHQKLAIINLLVSIALAGVMGCASGEPVVDDEQVDEVELALSGSIVTWIYYDGVAHTQEVGTCTFINCPDTPKKTTCTGRKTAFVEKIVDTCNADGP